MGSIPTQDLSNAVAQDQFTIHLRNTTAAANVHAYITGTDIQGNALFFLGADGTTPYYPANPPSNGAPLAEGCAIKLGGPGSSTPASIPHLSSGRIYFALGKLAFALNHGDDGRPGLVQPSPTDATHRDVKWGFAEFTWDASQMYANISFVDFVGLPIALALTSTSGGTAQVSGLPAGGMASVCEKLEGAEGNRAELVMNTTDGQGGGEYVRALSPWNGMVVRPGLFAGYYDDYVGAAWRRYRDETLLVKTDPGTTLEGRVGEDGMLRVGGEAFGRPSTADVFDNNSGPFRNEGSAQRLAVVPPLCAGFNRSTLLENRETPDPKGREDYYRDAVTNHYARVVHETTADGKGYAFPYDDVTPAGGKDQSGMVQSSDPDSLTVTVGRL